MDGGRVLFIFYIDGIKRLVVYYNVESGYWFQTESLATIFNSMDCSCMTVSPLKLIQFEHFKMWKDIHSGSPIQVGYGGQSVFVDEKGLMLGIENATSITSTGSQKYLCDRMIIKNDLKILNSISDHFIAKSYLNDYSIINNTVNIDIRNGVTYMEYGKYPIEIDSGYMRIILDTPERNNNIEQSDDDEEDDNNITVSFGKSDKIIIDTNTTLEPVTSLVANDTDVCTDYDKAGKFDDESDNNNSLEETIIIVGCGNNNNNTTSSSSSTYQHCDNMRVIDRGERYYCGEERNEYGESSSHINKTDSVNEGMQPVIDHKNNGHPMRKYSNKKRAHGYDEKPSSTSSPTSSSTICSDESNYLTKRRMVRCENVIIEILDDAPEVLDKTSLEHPKCDGNNNYIENVPFESIYDSATSSESSSQHNDYYYHRHHDDNYYDEENDDGNDSKPTVDIALTDDYIEMIMTRDDLVGLNLEAETESLYERINLSPDIMDPSVNQNTSLLALDNLVDLWNCI